MPYQLSDSSLNKLQGVDPHLVAVVRRAIAISRQDFRVIEGVRSREACMINYGKGRSIAECAAKGIPARYARPAEPKVTWLRDPFASKHCSGHAVDLVPYPVVWDDPEKFDAIARAMFAAAKELGVALRWGADWDKDGKPRERGETDSPHFEI